MLGDCRFTCFRPLLLHGLPFVLQRAILRALPFVLLFVLLLVLRVVLQS